MKKNIPKDMVMIDERKVMKQGSSLVVSIPRSLLKQSNCEKGDTVALYSNGKGQILIDLLPHLER